ncbi:MAG: DUF4340 domain-containing protein [Ruminococcus flavefaciens]|nr:DUF4340 domain-containing protein [Ruminococcus flavefaciens]MCM1228955.1 DUF4340 domain-containing protein [Ruminococcus flavefaciens]
MKKIIIAVAVLAVLAGISIGAFVAVKSNSDKEAQQQAETLADNVLFDIDSEAINKMEIRYPDSSYTADFTDDGEWVLTGSSTGEEFEMNQTTLNQICTFISTLTADTSYGEATEENKAKYGFNEPYEVTVYDDSSSYTLYIGGKSPTGDYYYAYTDTKNKIYAILSADAEAIITTRLSIQDDSFLPYSETEITALTVKKDGEIAYTFTKNADTSLWELPEEYSMLTVNQTRPSNIVTIITRLTAVEMFEKSADDFTKYGFDNPTAEFIVTASDGTEKTFLFSKYGKNAETYYHVYLKDSEQVETYYVGDFSFLDFEIYDLIMQTVECANMYAVSEFEINCPELTETFTIDQTEGIAECRGNEIDLNNAELISLFQTFYNIFSYIQITDIDVESQPELVDPVLSVKYTKTSGTETSIDLVSTGDGNKCFVFSDGIYTGTITDSSFISGSTSMVSAYEILCRQAGFEPNN